MKRNNKKGFTIVELVIVIAVIAILAGVLIPTFSGLIKKANINAAYQTASNAIKSVVIEEDGEFKEAATVVCLDEDGAVEYKFSYSGTELADEPTENDTEPVAVTDTSVVYAKNVETAKKAYSVAEGVTFTEADQIVTVEDMPAGVVIIK